MPVQSFEKTAAIAAPPSFTYGYLSRFVHFLGAAMFALTMVIMPHRAMAQGKLIRLVAFGDSLSAGYLLPANAAFPAALERALRAAGVNVEVANAGVSGDTAGGGLERLDWAVGEGADGVILELGANDMLRGLDPEITYKALTQIVTRLKAKGVKVLLAGMVAAPGMGRDYERRFNSVFTRIAAEQKVPLYPFFMAGVATEPKLLLRDGLHPTADGVEKIVAGILPMARALAESIAASAPGR